MATRTKAARPLRTLIGLFIVVVAIFGSVIIGNQVDDDASYLPKFALDLEGGTQLILTPVSTDASREPTVDDINQAIAIIRQRIDAQGVSEAEISNQGTNNIVIGIPGNPSQATLDLARRSAKMVFRTVLKSEQGSYGQTADWTARSFIYDNASGEIVEPTPTPAATDGSEDGTATDGAPTVEPTSSWADAQEEAAKTAYATRLTDSLSTSLITADVQARYDELDCSSTGSFRTGEPADPDQVLVTCDTNPYVPTKYILGPVVLDGSMISSASSGMSTTAQGNITGEWEVQLELTTSGGIARSGADQFYEVSKKLVDQTSPLNQFAIVLDDQVVSAPTMNEPIPSGRARISGSFDQTSSKTLADQLNFGSLPLNFNVQAENRVSATLGSDQLQKGLLAGLIGLILVAIYSLFQYRALAFVTVLSLVFATGTTYGTILLLSWLQGYRLSLAGVAGIIVSIGITADSFIVYFERIRDELRDGRVLGQAVERGWSRARRTILASDAVNFLAAVVLYLISVGGVRGFAFTLGLTTVMDVVVVFLFTHPIILLLTKTKFFGGGHPWSGLDPHRLGAPGSVHYAGRGRVTHVPDRPDGAGADAVAAKPRATVAAGAPVPAGVGSIAERKAAAARAAAGSVEASVEAKEDES